MSFDYFNLDPAFKACLMPFSPLTKMAALRTVDAYFKAIDAGDEELANACEATIDEATGDFAAAVHALLRVCDTAAVFV